MYLPMAIYCSNSGEYQTTAIIVKKYIHLFTEVNPVESKMDIDKTHCLNSDILRSITKNIIKELIESQIDLMLRAYRCLTQSLL